MTSRQIVLDTETTGLEPERGHRIIEIGCVELINRRLTGKTFHQYLNPDRSIDEGAIEVHGITNEFLDDKLRFPQIVDDLMAFISGAELIIHNAPFDISFLNHEINLLKQSDLKFIEHYCNVVDTLVMARHQHPGQRNSLDALCRRYSIDNSQRALHGALLDAEILADVYLAMTGGQVSLGLDERSASEQAAANDAQLKSQKWQGDLLILRASDDECAAHNEYLDYLNQKSSEGHLWGK